MKQWGQNSYKIFAKGIIFLPIAFSNTGVNFYHASPTENNKNDIQAWGPSINDVSPVFQFYDPLPSPFVIFLLSKFCILDPPSLPPSLPSP